MRYAYMFGINGLGNSDKPLGFLALVGLGKRQGDIKVFWFFNFKLSKRGAKWTKQKRKFTSQKTLD